MLKQLEKWYKVQKKKKSFWAKLSVAVLSILVAGLFAIKYYFYKDQIAVLKTKIDLVKDNEKDKEYDTKQAAISAERVENFKKIEKNSQKIVETEARIKEVDKSLKNDHDVIESLESWDDVDKKVH